MGSLFSSHDDDHPRHLISMLPRAGRDPRERVGRPMFKEMLATVDQGHDGRVFTIEESYADCTCWLAHGVLKHFNANNPGAQYLVDSTAEMKAACTGFGKDLIWYHLSFSARQRDNAEMDIFFAELCYDIDSEKINLETCTILEKPFRTSCAFCPEESKIMHPCEPQFVCGKEGQETEFFCIAHMLLWPYENCVGDLDLVDGQMMIDRWADDGQ
ncbi:uncharacterized protein [Lolium perenne]|uniref:uncharacterized protein n=1 Tax=Lolium perenne TaxID=4522 RepID=UPI0021F5F3A1|nr:uncharacterized protein LOC127325884 [Lolium perenne]